jgi:hypothetical protein
MLVVLVLVLVPDYLDGTLNKFAAGLLEPEANETSI